MKPNDTTTMTRYLLGQLPAAERDACEQEWFTNQEQYVQLCEAETALIDAYVRNDLRGAERALFEQHFLTIPARRDRVQSARALVQLIAQPAAKPESWWQRLSAALRAPKLIPAVAMGAIALLMAGGLWSVWQRRPSGQELAQPGTPTVVPQRPTPQPTQIARATETPALTPSPAASPSLPKTLLFALTAGVLRSDDNESLRTLKLASSIERVQLQVTLPASDYRQFAATLRTAEGRDLTRWHNVKAANTPAGARLTLNLPAKTLKPGDYILVVSGINPPREAEELRRLPFKVSH
jgi:hypothetical protein